MTRWWLIGSLLLAWPRPSAAECGDRATSLSPDGGTVPPHPVLYLFQPRGHSAEVRMYDEQNRRVSFDQVRLSDAPAFTAYRLKVQLPRGDFSVIYGGQLARFTADPEHMVEYQTVIDAVRFNDQVWSCSHERSIDLRITGEAVAYRLEWDQDGQRVAAWLPSSLATMSFLYPERHDYEWIQDRDSRVLPARSMLRIGHVGCLGTTVPAEPFAASRHIDLVALFTDGTELRLGRGGDLGFGELDAEAPTGMIGIYPSSSSDHRRRAASLTWVVPAVSAGTALATLLAAALLVRLRRRPRPHDARL